jgi:hypothetical protein
MTAPALTVPTSAAPLAADPLGPIRATLLAMAARPDQPPLGGISPGLTIDGTPGWQPATAIVSGRALESLLEAAHQRWHAAAHAAAALAFKSYSFWLALPAVLGYAAARRVPLMRPDAVMVRWSVRRPFLAVGLTTSVEVAVLPSDPLAVAGQRAAGVRVVADSDALLQELRQSMMDEHLAPIVDQISARRHLGHRTLWGSVASGVAHGFSRSAGVVAGSTLETASHVLTALGLDDLVDLAPAQGDGAGLSVRRRTCCLAFTLPRPKVCTDCCIR